MKNTNLEEKEQKKKDTNMNILSFLFQGLYKKIAIIIAILIIALCFFGGIRLGKILYGSSITEKKTQITDTLLYQQLAQENELSTVRYFYTNMGKYENSIELGSTRIPFTKKSFIISYDGIIKAGIDMDKVKIQIDGKIITISIPKAEILSHEIKEDSVQVYDEKNSIFNGLSVEDIMNFQQQEKQEMEEKAIGNGILVEAQENAKTSLQFLYNEFLEDDQYEDGYTLEFRNDF